MKNEVTIEQVICARNEIIYCTYMMTVKYIDQFGCFSVILIIPVLTKDPQIQTQFISVYCATNGIL